MGEGGVVEMGEMKEVEEWGGGEMRVRKGEWWDVIGKLGRMGAGNESLNTVNCWLW